MKIAFHSNQLGLRGTDVALYDYAFYNREVLEVVRARPDFFFLFMNTDRFR